MIRDEVEGSTSNPAPSQIFNSREGSNKPQLVITYTQAP
jgi:hypothetical protein